MLHPVPSPCPEPTVEAPARSESPMPVAGPGSPARAVGTIVGFRTGRASRRCGTAGAGAGAVRGAAAIFAILGVGSAGPGGGVGIHGGASETVITGRSATTGNASGSRPTRTLRSAPCPTTPKAAMSAHLRLMELPQTDDIARPRSIRSGPRADFAVDRRDPRCWRRAHQDHRKSSRSGSAQRHAG